MIGQFPKDLQALEAVFAFLAEFVAQQGLDEGVGLRIDLITEELFTNMVKYGAGGGDRVQVSVERDGPLLQLELVDFDVEPFDPQSVEPALLGNQIRERRAGGLGLHLVRSLADELQYEYRGRDMRVRVTTRVGS